MATRRAWQRFKLWGIAGIAFVLSLIVVVLLRPAVEQKIPIKVALAVPLSTPGGQEIQQSIQLYFDSVNQSGGINGHPLQLLPFDDKASTDTAVAVAQEIVKSPALVVLGHRGSDASLSAGKIYQANGLAAITGTANSDRLTTEIPTYFRTVYNNSTFNSVLSIYAKQVLGLQTARIIFDQSSANERSQAEALQAIFKGEKFPIDINEAQRTTSIQKVVQQLQAEKQPYLIILTNSKEEVAKDVVMLLRQGGITSPIVGDQALARESFAKLFAGLPEEKENPGFYTDGMYALTPILFDSAGADAQEFLIKYETAYSASPSYLGAKFYDSALMAVSALQKAKLQLTTAALANDRQEVLNQLKTFNSRKNALNGLSGLTYFNTNRSSNLPARVATFQDYRLLSAPQQFTPIFDTDTLDLETELKAGLIVTAQDKNQTRYYWRQRVVYTGIDINRLNRIEQNRSSYTIDFYLWFRYSGKDDQPVFVQFPDAVVNSTNPTAPIYDPKNPAISEIINGLNYRLYQVRGDFRNAFDFRDYPFDRQRLNLRFDNPLVPSDRLIYVIDKVGLKLPKPPEIERRPFQGLQLWQFRDMIYSQDTARSVSTLGDPNLAQLTTPIDYPGFSVRIDLQRRSLVFLTKNLFPLFLLASFTYITLYFPYSMFVPRIMAPASALLSGIVLLLSFNNQLPEISYTVAIEYVFYTYFFLCLVPIIVTAVGTGLEKAGRKSALNRLDISARIFYPAVIFSLILTYSILYSSRLV